MLILMRAPRRDVVARHHCAAPIMTWTWLMVLPLPASFFICSRRKKHPDQVLRRRRHHQIGERGFFGREHRGLVAAVLSQRSNQRVGRRIMLARRGGLSSLRAHPRTEQAAHRRGIQDGVEDSGPRAFQAGRTTASLTALRTCRSSVHRIDQPQRFGLAGVDGPAGSASRSSPASG